MPFEEEFVHLWSGLQGELRARLLQRGASLDEAEELVQETGVRLWRHWRRVHPEARRAWAWRVCWNLWMQRFREEGRRRRVLNRAGERLDAGSVDPLLEAVERRDEAARRQRMMQLLWRLPLRDRLALWLMATAPSSSAAAAALGIEWESLRVRVHRARRRLMQALAAGV